MPQRLRLFDWRTGNGPAKIGIAQGNINGCAAALNTAQERLLYAKEANDFGWTGGWAEMVFSVDREHPYITCNRGIARLEAMDICSRPVALNNQFYEYLLFG